MFDYEESPPPLHHSPSPSDRSQFNSRDTTPVTPIGNAPPCGKKTDKDILPWFRKPIDVGRTTTRLCLDSSLLEPDFDDTSFPTFGASSPNRGMASVANPLDISVRQTSTSPRGNQTSNLTSALQRSDSEEKRKMANSTAETTVNRPIPQMPANTPDDFTRFEHGARPISMKGVANDKRRESIAQSLGTGMSWGGVSVGSWIRDDMMMSGTSPFTFNSPSFHSSSYLPKLEANFMKDFSCCGLTLPTLHDLLQHYEEAHAQRDPVTSDANQQPVPDSRAAIAANTAVQVQQEAQQRNQQQQHHPPNAPGRPYGTQQSAPQAIPRPTGFSSTLQTIPDMDTVEDMEMDDIDGADETTPPPNLYTQNQSQTSPQTSFAGPTQPQIPQLNTTMMQGHQAYRQSTPNTPVAPGRASVPFQGSNASSTLMGNPMQQFQDLQNAYRGTPDSSAPGTPGELADGLMSGMDDMTMQNNPLFNGLQNGFGNFSFGMNSDMIDLCIDEPAKRLFSPGIQGMSQGQAQNLTQNRLGTGQYGANSEIARTIRERQAAAGLPDTTTNILPHEEPKPFRCPVIGCEKAYKNQNGLKYHKSHGHNNQRLHENGDGTFSIVDPDTQAPYPGTMGMEKEKPYKCEVCQKRYKNLNGLKYHKTHSPPCNPELQMNANKSPSLGMAKMMAGPTTGNMGAGLSGDLTMM